MIEEDNQQGLEVIFNAAQSTAWLVVHIRVRREELEREYVIVEEDEEGETDGISYLQ